MGFWTLASEEIRENSMIHDLNRCPKVTDGGLDDLREELWQVPLLQNVLIKRNG